MEIEYDDSNSDMYRQHTSKPKVKKKRSGVARLVWMVGGQEHEVLDTGTWALMQKRKREISRLYTVGNIEVKS